MPFSSKKNSANLDYVIDQAKKAIEETRGGTLAVDVADVVIKGCHTIVQAVKVDLAQEMFIQDKLPVQTQQALAAAA